MTEGPLLSEGLVWVASCPLFTGVFDPVANFSTPAWSDTEVRAPCLSTRRAMWHDLFRVDLLIMLMAVSFKCHKHQYFKETPSHEWNIDGGRSGCQMPITVSCAYRPSFPLVASYDTPGQWLMYS